MTFRLRQARNRALFNELDDADLTVAIHSGEFRSPTHARVGRERNDCNLQRRSTRFSRAPPVRRYLNTIGVKRDSLVLPSLTYGDVTTELFDLSDAARLAAANAETYPAPKIPTNSRPGCRPWIKPSATDSLWSN